jgi:hypothetical protein
LFRTGISNHFGVNCAQYQRCRVKGRVIVITEMNRDLVQSHVMEHKGIRYTVRIGIAREQWRVAIYPLGDGSPKEKTVTGTHEDAKIAARSMINSWLKQQQSALKKTKQ